MALAAGLAPWSRSCQLKGAPSALCAGTMARRENQPHLQLVAGTISGLAQLPVGHPFDSIKVRAREAAAARARTAHAPARRPGARARTAGWPTCKGVRSVELPSARCGCAHAGQAAGGRGDARARGGRGRPRGHTRHAAARGRARAVPRHEPAPRHHGRLQRGHVQRARGREQAAAGDRCAHAATTRPDVVAREWDAYRWQTETNHSRRGSKDGAATGTRARPQGFTPCAVVQARRRRRSWTAS